MLSESKLGLSVQRGRARVSWCQQISHLVITKHGPLHPRAPCVASIVRKCMRHTTDASQHLHAPSSCCWPGRPPRCAGIDKAMTMERGQPDTRRYGIWRHEHAWLRGHALASKRAGREGSGLGPAAAPKMGKNWSVGGVEGEDQLQCGLRVDGVDCR